MRTLTVFIVVSSANAVAGSLLVLAFWQSSISFTAGLIGLGVAIGGAALGWGYRTYVAGLRQLMKLANQESDVRRPAISELDAIGRCFEDGVENVRQTAATEMHELAEMKRLLAKFDHRNDEYGRDGQLVDLPTRLETILKACATELESSVRQAVSCGREIHRATQEIVIGSETQSDSVDQTTSLIEQLSSRMISVCDNAEQALDSSSKAKSTADRGLQEFQELVDEMKQIRNHAAARERKLQALGQHTKEIESIVQTIGTLSSRTDLLALNASIESVRAGEHGRGFAIVAEEVRALAEQSAQAVLDISRRIEMIQLETHQSISVASGEHDQMHTVIKRVTETLASLEDILNAAGQSSDGLNEISVSTNQQLQLTREIIVALERNTEATKKNRSRAEGANWTAKSLDEIGIQLQSTLETFRAGGVLESADHARAHSNPVGNQPVHHEQNPVATS